MHDLAQRAEQAQHDWLDGDRALARGDLAAAYRLYTQAHDLVTDCPALHRQAHQRLIRVNARNGRRGEWFTDRLLLAAAPLGVFTLIAWYFRSRVTADERCRRAVD